MDNNESRLTRIDPELAATIKALAEASRRSFAGQVNYMLTRALEAAQAEH